MSTGSAVLVLALPAVLAVGAVAVVAGAAARAAEEARRRREAAARDRFRRAVVEARRLERAIQRSSQLFGHDLGVTAPAPPVVGPEAGPAAFETAADSVVVALACAREGYERAVTAARARALATRAVTVGDHDLDDDLVDPSRGHTPESDWSALADVRRGEVERECAHLPAEIDSGLLGSAEVITAEALGAPDQATYDRALDRLRMVVQTAEDENKRRRANLVEIEELRSRLDGLGGPGIDEMARVLDEVDPGEWLPDNLYVRVAAVAEAARAEQDRAYALGAVAESLDELGYEVETGFSTAVADGGALVPIPETRQRAVRISEHGGSLSFEVVPQAGTVRGDGEAELQADAEAEQAWCDDHEELREALRERGVKLVYEELAPPRQPPRPPVRARRRRTRHDDRRTSAARREVKP